MLVHKNTLEDVWSLIFVGKSKNYDTKRSKFDFLLRYAQKIPEMEFFEKNPTSKNQHRTYLIPTFSQVLHYWQCLYRGANLFRFSCILNHTELADV